MSPLTDTITVRLAYADDHIALQRLAALDSAVAPPPAPLLLAEAGGALRAAVSLADGSAIADPFYPSAALVALLRSHAVAQTPRHRRRWLLPVGRLRLA